MKDRGTTKIDWLDYHHNWQKSEGEVIEEIVLTINVNGEELISLMGTPLNQDWLAVGFLFNEGLISELSEIEDLRISEDGCCIDVWLSHQIEKPARAILTSGCGGGQSFEDPRQEKMRYVRRCIAAGGDTIEMRQGCILVNGKILTEPYVRPSFMDTLFLPPELDVWNNWGPYIVPQRSLFVMGDNRDAETDFDSRFDGMLNVRYVVGKVMYIF